MSDAKMLCPRCWGSKIEPGRNDRNCTYCMGDGIAENTQLSDHFWLDEFVRSPQGLRAGLSNDPTAAILSSLRSLATGLLEPIRSVFGPVFVSSGYRSPDVNRLIHGAVDSVHRTGDAGDIEPTKAGVKRRDLVDWLMKQNNLLFDQLIFEGTWVHVGRMSPAGHQRRQVLMMFMNSKKECVYSPYDPNDKRVVL